MKKNLCLIACAGTILIFVSCDRSQQRQADRKAEQARAKARELGKQAEQEARRIKDQVNGAVSQGASRESMESARAKLRAGTADLTNAADKAALVARVKTQLANDAGLRTVGTIDVDADGSTITLHGTVPSAAKKKEVEKAAAEVPGVSHVEDDLQIQP